MSAVYGGPYGATFGLADPLTGTTNFVRSATYSISSDGGSSQIQSDDTTMPEAQTNTNPPEWGAPEWEQMSSEEFADSLIAKLETEEASLTAEEMDIIEQFWRNDIANRRATLIMLTKPFSEIREQIENDRSFAVAAAAVFDCIEPDKYQAIADLLSDAQRRLMGALACREDMQEIMKEAKEEGVEVRP